MPSELPSTWPLGDALRTADAVLANELGVIEGSIKLAGRAHSVVSDWRLDPDFVVQRTLRLRVHQLRKLSRTLR
jgi:hypothetical protein